MSIKVMVRSIRHGEAIYRQGLINLPPSRGEHQAWCEETLSARLHSQSQNDLLAGQDGLPRAGGHMLGVDGSDFQVPESTNNYKFTTEHGERPDVASCENRRLREVM